MFGPVGVEVVVDSKFDPVHEPAHKAVLGKDVLVGLHGALHEQQLGVGTGGSLTLMLEPGGKGIELKGVRPALWVLVKQLENVGVFIFYYVLPLLHWLGGNFIGMAPFEQSEQG